MEMLSRAQWVSAVGAVVLAIVVLDLVRRRRLSEEYSLLWVVASILGAVLGFSTPLLQWITRSLGIRYETSTVFFIGLVFATVVLLYQSVRLSRLGQDHLALTRELTFLRHEVERLSRPGPESQGL